MTIASKALIRQNNGSLIGIDELRILAQNAAKTINDIISIRFDKDGDGKISSMEIIQCLIPLLMSVFANITGINFNKLTAEAKDIVLYEIAEIIDEFLKNINFLEPNQKAAINDFVKFMSYNATVAPAVIKKLQLSFEGGLKIIPQR